MTITNYISVEKLIKVLTALNDLKQTIPKMLSRVKEEVLDIAPSLPSEPCIRLSPYTAQATS
jgi:hypothetical protein